MRVQCFLRLLFGILLAIVASPVAAQFELSPTLSKETFLAGEPVFLNLTVKNVSNQQLRLDTANPFTMCSGYSFALQGARDRYAMGCAGGAGSCLSGFLDILPGKSFTDRVLLNARYDVRQPGHYLLMVSYRASYAPGSGKLPVAALLGHQVFQKQIEIVLAPSTPEQLKPIFAPYLQDLNSPNLRKQMEAADVISYLAPAFMESTFLRMLRTPGKEAIGVEAARNLGTPSAHRALAEFVKEPPVTNFPGLHQKAIRYLGEIGDTGDVPVLLDATHRARDTETRRVAMEALATAGRAVAIPVLENELRDPSKDTRDLAEDALPFTGSRSAVPVLIQLMQSPDERLRTFAEFGLEELTHLRGAKLDGVHSLPTDAYSKWSRWWVKDGQTATIFKEDQCGEIKLIPSS
ncbi:HEAT repeat domain-containing protein [Occallatibacter savannae]|uniref:HEAT repeat domain-containing protein n=1 Tax=Occallatibacter savannae TaxID=1002691 RepID=UPI000D6906F7|nr:HEAT repeat domain-containing protein [Occallatibacter savannae]